MMGACRGAQGTRRWGSDQGGEREAFPRRGHGYQLRRRPWGLGVLVGL